MPENNTKTTQLKLDGWLRQKKENAELDELTEKISDLTIESNKKCTGNEKKTSNKRVYDKTKKNQVKMVVKPDSKNGVYKWVTVSSDDIHNLSQESVCLDDKDDTNVTLLTYDMHRQLESIGFFPTFRKCKRYLVGQVADALQLINQKHRTSRQVAKEMNIPEYTVRGWIKASRSESFKADIIYDPRFRDLMFSTRLSISARQFFVLGLIEKNPELSLNDISELLVKNFPEQNPIYARSFVINYCGNGTRSLLNVVRRKNTPSIVKSRYDWACRYFESQIDFTAPHTLFITQVDFRVHPSSANDSRNFGNELFKTRRRYMLAITTNRLINIERIRLVYDKDDLYPRNKRYDLDFIRHTLQIAKGIEGFKPGWVLIPFQLTDFDLIAEMIESEQFRPLRMPEESQEMNPAFHLCVNIKKKSWDTYGNYPVDSRVIYGATTCDLEDFESFCQASINAIQDAYSKKPFTQSSYRFAIRSLQYTHS